MQFCVSYYKHDADYFSQLNLKRKRELSDSSPGLSNPRNGAVIGCDECKGNVAVNCTLALPASLELWLSGPARLVIQ